MTRIEHYATYLQGGAGAAARRIFEGIRAEIESGTGAEWATPKDGRLSSSDWQLELLCRSDQPLTEPYASHFVPSDSFFDRTWPRRWNRQSFKQAAEHYHRHLKDRPPEYEGFSPARLYEPTARSSRVPVDLIHLHWVAFLLDYPTFLRSIPAATPIVWTLHDMNAFTGGCHYSAGCERYRSGCGNCFQLANPHAEDLSAVAWNQKKSSYLPRKFTIVTPCQWLTERARESGLFPARTEYETIHYGLDTEAYRPIDTTLARERLGLDPGRLTLLFGAADVGVPRKGAAVLVQALRGLPDPQKYQCVVFGGGDWRQTGLDDLPGSLLIKDIGFLETAEQKAVAYSAADMFVLPSLEDNQPQTGLESLACGTPVVAFDTGGISEFVRHAKTGLLARVNDPASLARQIRWLAESPESRREFGENGRRLVENEFERKRQSQRYIQLYQSLLARRRGSVRRAG